MMLDFHKHKWSIWSKAIQTYGGSQIQVRRCETCGAISHRYAINIMSAQVQSNQVNDAVDSVKGIEAQP